MVKKCLYCGKDFTAKKDKQLTCGSYECLKERKKDLARQKRGMVIKKTIKCVVCGKEFTPRSTTAKLCSQKCREIHLRELRREAAQREREYDKAKRKARALKPHKSIEEIVTLAKAEGISYGQYVGMHGGK